MTVLALITNPAEARTVVAVAQHSAVALETDLSIMCYEYRPVVEEADRTEIEQHEFVRHVLHGLSSFGVET